MKYGNLGLARCRADPPSPSQVVKWQLVTLRSRGLLLVLKLLGSIHNGLFWGKEEFC